MAFDYKKECREFYMPKAKPAIVTVPKMNYIAVRGTGDPNEEGGAYKASIGMLYAIAYTIKMSKKGEHQIEGYFDYVVPPLEGFWWQDGVEGFDLRRKQDFSQVEFLEIEEGLCVQLLHKGPFDNELESVAIMDKYIEDQGYENDFNDDRLHHEIYLSDARRVAQEKWKTVIRHPIRKK